MIDISLWLKDFINAINKEFADRVWFIGLQGSYARGEATEKSDIDVVVILDDLSPIDIRRYNMMLDVLPHRELVCGFLSGKNVILNWEPSDLFQFYYDTKPIKGSLDELINLIDCDAVIKAIRLGAGNIYHGCVHNMLHEKSDDIVKELYKSASFVVQAKHFIETGKYVSNQKDLLSAVSDNDRFIVETYMFLKNGVSIDFDRMSDALYKWSKNIIENIDYIN